MIEGLHAMRRLAGLHHAVDLMDLVFSDQIADGIRRHQDFDRQRSTGPTGSRQQRLTEDAFQHEGELDPNLALLGSWKDVDDTVDRLSGRIGMQGSKGEMASLGDSQG